MASSTGLICSECQKKEKTSAANTWCPECCKSLCASCKKKHDKSNTSINHKTIPADVFQKLPTFVSDLNVHCDEHNIKHEKYCPDHQLLLCKKCIATSHKTCKGFLSLEQVTKTTNSSVRIEKMKKSFDDIQLTINEIKQNRNDNLTSLHQQIKDIHKEISNFRSQLTQTLDNMEKQLVNQMEKVKKKTKSQMTILYKDLLIHENKIEEMKRGIEGLEKYGTDFQTFLAGIQVENIVHKEEGYLQSLIDTNVCESIIMKFSTDSYLQTLVRGNVNFGHISVETLPSAISVITHNIRGSQLPVRSNFSQIPIAQRFRVKSTKTITCSVTAMCVLPNMDMVFIGKNSIKNEATDFDDQTVCLIVHDSEGLLKYSFPLENVREIEGITSVDDRTVAFIDGPAYPLIEVKFIDILNKKVIKILQLNNFSLSISRSNDILYVAIYGHGLDQISLVDNSLKPFYYSGGSSHWYVTTFGNKICCSNSHTDEVILLNSASDVLWKYKDDTLGSPGEATFDKQGNIYVVGQNTYNVVFISHDGKKSRQFLSKEDGIMNTMSIGFDYIRNRLIVVSLLGDVVIYNCS